MTLDCLTCGKPIRLVSLIPVAWGHEVNPTFMHHPARPPRMRTEAESAWKVSREPDLTKRIAARVDGYPDAQVCWSWLGLVDTKGYGRIMVRYQEFKVHRVAYETWVGPIPAGLTLDHLCRNRRCVNPAHLEPVTNRENVLRGEGITAKLARKTNCLRGHPLPPPGPDGRRRCRPCDRGLYPSKVARSTARANARLARAEHDPLRARAQLGASDTRRGLVAVPDASDPALSRAVSAHVHAGSPSNPAVGRVELGVPLVPSSAPDRSVGSDAAGER